jgi:hypothetical protein
MPIEAESPEQFGCERIRFNLAESSLTARGHQVVLQRDCSTSTGNTLSS